MPRFVLLEHRWQGIHWDFMLEAGEVLRTWAIDGPVVPDADLPARALPDHRRVYLDYEGEVSANRGTVRRIDRGPYSVQIWEKGHVRVRLQGDQLVGEVEIRQDSRLESDGGGSWIFRLGKVD
jgi:DNA polymerase Ligase (LigD)